MHAVMVQHLRPAAAGVSGERGARAGRVGRRRTAAVVAAPTRRSCSTRASITGSGPRCWADPHVLAYFSTPSGEPIGDYLQRVRARFGRWIIDTCTRPYAERWLAYQQEIALRHTEAKKNRTDRADSVPSVPLRHLVAFVYPITATMRPFLAAGGHDDEQVEAMYQAWFKAVTLQVALWSQPYAGPAW
ncbi:MAG: hypothetical protein HOV86_27150 [Thermoactinospora sp.]|nr:hypothetical protein [Thermoactinospora sp.]